MSAVWDPVLLQQLIDKHLPYRPEQPSPLGLYVSFPDDEAGDASEGEIDAIDAQRQDIKSIGAVADEIGESASPSLIDPALLHDAPTSAPLRVEGSETGAADHVSGPQTKAREEGTAAGIPQRRGLPRTEGTGTSSVHPSSLPAPADDGGTSAYARRRDPIERVMTPEPDEVGPPGSRPEPLGGSTAPPSALELVREKRRYVDVEEREQTQPWVKHKRIGEGTRHQQQGGECEEGMGWKTEQDKKEEG